jgi:uncharacterized protein (TIGR02246 family)
MSETMSTNDDEQSILVLIAQQQKAWNAGDADAFAARFHADGTFTNVYGERYIGRESFRTRHAALFNTFGKGCKTSFTVRRIHFPVPGTALVDIDSAVEDCGTFPPGLSLLPNGTLRTSLLQVIIKDQTGWWTVGYHNVDIKEVPAEAVNK